MWAVLFAAGVLCGVLGAHSAMRMGSSAALNSANPQAANVQARTQRAAPSFLESSASKEAKRRLRDALQFPSAAERLPRAWEILSAWAEHSPEAAFAECLRIAKRSPGHEDRFVADNLLYRLAAQ